MKTFTLTEVEKDPLKEEVYKTVMLWGFEEYKKFEGVFTKKIFEKKFGKGKTF